MGKFQKGLLLMDKAALAKFFKSVQNQFDIFLPYEIDKDDPDNLMLKKFRNEEKFVINKYRTIDPLKSLFYLSSESVLPSTTKNKQRIIAGVKNCDLLSLGVHDAALLEDDFVDPNFKKWRENTYIISGDCDEALSTCHCNILGHNAYPDTKGEEMQKYDINLSPVDDEYLISIGSEKGEELLQLIKQNCEITEAEKYHVEEVERQHKEIEEKLMQINAEFSPERDVSVVSKVKDAKVWEELCEECVQCGGCTNICPSCYCIIVNDESINDDFKRIRTWDSCQLSGYARVAGGESPRDRLWERFRNRYQCKFDFIKQNFSQYGCKGCGRCISVCPAEIDLREVIKALQEV